MVISLLQQIYKSTTILMNDFLQHRLCDYDHIYNLQTKKNRRIKGGLYVN